MSYRPQLLKQADAPILVVAEGHDERRIIFELLIRRDPRLIVVSPPNFNSLSSQPDVQIVVAGDRDFARLAGLGPVIPRFGGVRRLVLVFDAEEGPVETFVEIKANLVECGFQLPELPWEESSSGERTCVIAVLPDGTSTGSLEAMLLDGVVLTPTGSADLRCVDDFIACIGRDGDELTARQGKRRLYSWLSVQEEPTRFAGEAAAADVLPLQTPQLQRLADLILGTVL